MGSEEGKLPLEEKLERVRKTFEVLLAEAKSKSNGNGG